jgi:hypothetical protein
MASLRVSPSSVLGSVRPGSRASLPKPRFASRPFGLRPLMQGARHPTTKSNHRIECPHRATISPLPFPPRTTGIRWGGRYQRATISVLRFRTAVESARPTRVGLHRTAVHACYVVRRVAPRRRNFSAARLASSTKALGSAFHLAMLTRAVRRNSVIKHGAGAAQSSIAPNSSDRGSVG